MTDRDGRDEAHAIPACRCGHYSHEHERRAHRPPGPCWLCDCKEVRRDVR